MQQKKKTLLQAQIIKQDTGKGKEATCSILPVPKMPFLPPNCSGIQELG